MTQSSTFTRTVVLLATIAVSASTILAQRTTWLIMDKTDGYAKIDWKPGQTYEEAKCCWHRIDGFLPNTPRILTQAPNYKDNGYWFMVVNTVEAASSKPGSMGSVRFHVSNGHNYYKYFTNCRPKGDTSYFTRSQRDLELGKATIWASAWSSYDGNTNMSSGDWNLPLSYLAFGPIPAVGGCAYDLREITPVKFRIRVWISLNKNFVPPRNPNDPVGVQPLEGSTVTAGVLSIKETPATPAHGICLLLGDRGNVKSGAVRYSLQGTRLNELSSRNHITLGPR